MSGGQGQPHPQHEKRIGLREFLRGGYHNLKEPVVVTYHKKPVGIWTPIDSDEVPSPTNNR